MRPIRVLFVDHETRLSGGQQDLVDLVAALDPSLVEAHVALPGPGPLAEALRGAGATVHPLEMGAPLRRLSRWALARRPHIAVRHAGALAAASLRLARLLRRIRPDVVHTNSMKAHLLAILPARAWRLPLIWHVRDVLQPGWIRIGFAALGAFPARILCLSRVAAGQFRHARVRRKVRVVYNGIRLDRFRPDEATRWRARFGAPNGEVLVGMVGQIARWKGQDVFVEAAARVRGSHPGVRFVIVGDCLFPQNEAGFARAVRERAERLGLDGALVWAGWTDEVTGAVAALDILVHASRLPEPFGRVLLEGMAAGKPVVASTAGAAPEIVPARAGLLVPPGDPEVLARAISALAADAEARRRCGAAGRRAARRFDIATTARAVTAVYTEILGCA